MKLKQLFVTICCVFLLLFTSNIFGQNNKTYKVQTLLNRSMPLFSATDITGKYYDAKRFKNKVIFINFWFLDCPPCIQELKQLSDLYKNYSTNPNVVFISINFYKTKDIKSFISTSDTLEVGGKIRTHYKKFLSFNNLIQYPIISSTDKKIEKLYKIEAWPTSLIIDKKGIIRLINIGLKLDEPDNYLFAMYSKKMDELLAK